MAVRPKPNLPEQAQPWGRHVEADIDELAVQVSRTNQDTQANLQQLNGGLGLVSEQVNTLSSAQNEIVVQQQILNSLTTTSVSGTGLSSTDTTDVPVVSSQVTPTLTFTVDRKVRARFTLRATVRLFLSWVPATTVPTKGIVLVGVDVNGTNVARGISELSFLIAGTSGTNGTSNVVNAESIVTLVPGTYTAQSFYQFQGSGYSVLMNIGTPILTVDILNVVTEEDDLVPEE